MKNSLKRAARAAFKPNAVIMGVAACLFGWAVAESLVPVDEFGRTSPAFPEEVLFFSCALFVASAGLATGRAGGRLLAAVLSGPLPLLQIYLPAMIPYHFEVGFLSAEHVERWLHTLARMPADFWLMTALSFAILCSATAATLRRTPSRP
jgi:hypothetical protein